MGILKAMFHKAKPNTPTPKQAGVVSTFELPPINGGNAIEVNTNLNAKQSQIQEFINLSVDKIKKNHYNYWELLNMQVNYFTGLTPFTFNDIETDALIYKFFRLGWLYGDCCIWFHEGKQIPLKMDTWKTNIDGSISNVVGTSMYAILTNPAILEDPKKQEKYQVKIPNEELDNIIWLKNDSYGINNMIKWTKFIDMQTSLLKKINNRIYTLTKNYIIRTADPTSAKQEIETLYDDDSPFIIDQSPVNPLVNNIRSMENAIGSANTEEIFKFYEAFTNMYYELLGRRTNTEFKQERSLTGEIKEASHNYNALEVELYTNRINFLDAYSKKTNKTYRLLNNASIADLEGYNDTSNSDSEQSEFKQTNTL